MAKKGHFEPANISRREMMKRVGAGVAGATVAAPIAGIPAAAAAQTSTTPAPAREALEALTGAQSDTLEAICARIIPTDATGPGAAEARAAHYIDRALTGPLATSKAAYVSGLAAVDAYAQASKGAAFAKLAPADQDAVLTDIEKNVAKGFRPSAAAFFDMVRTHTIEGTFSDPYYGGNANFVGWDLLGYPGLRLAVSKEEQSMRNAPKVVRGSAYDEALFSKGGGHGH